MEEGDELIRFHAIDYGTVSYLNGKSYLFQTAVDDLITVNVDLFIQFHDKAAGRYIGIAAFLQRNDVSTGNDYVKTSSRGSTVIRTAEDPAVSVVISDPVEEQQSSQQESGRKIPMNRTTVLGIIIAAAVVVIAGAIVAAKRSKPTGH